MIFQFISPEEAMDVELNTKFSNKLNLPIFLIGLIIMSFGIIILIGWIFELNLSEYLFPNFYTTKPIAAINIILSGFCIVFLSNVEIKKSTQYIVLALSSIIFFIALTTLILMMFDLDISKDTEPYHKNIQILFSLFAPWQMPPSTSFCFLLIGISFLLKVLPISPRIELPILFSLTAVIFIIGILVFLGYATEYFFGFHIWNYAGVGIQTPLAFILIAYALYSLAKKQSDFKWGLDPVTTLGFFIGLLTLLFISSSSEYSIQSLHLYANQISSTEDALNRSGELQNNLLHYLSLERVYIITGNEAPLDKRISIKEQLKTDFKELHQYVSNNPSIQHFLNQIEPLIHEKISITDQVIEVRKTQGYQAAINLKNKNDNAALTNKIDNLFALMRNKIYKELKEQLAKKANASKKMFQFLPLETFSSLTILFLSLFFLNQRIHERKIALDQKRRLQDQLQQSQKMQAIGQLVGGIAHDFNNLLGIIIGNLDLLEGMLENNESASKRAKAASNAALRGAEITRRLLSFSRFDQLNPKPVSINETIKNTLVMIKRALGPDIEIVQNLDASEPIVLIDEAEFDNVILNLAVNARDAMPKGGKLIISTEIKTLGVDYPPVQATEMKPGTYVRVAVADTGMGMPPEVIERAFEPFYTTKPVGKGTGLGLAMVYGFAKQSGGYVKIYSEVNQGTSITLYLPFTEKTVEPTQTGKEDPTLKFSGLALTVDDEPDLLDIATIYLTEMGFQVFQAQNAHQALETFRAHPNISLVLTDIIMPGGMNGVELSEKIKIENPNITIVFASGFHGEVLSEKIGKNLNELFLQKPYQKREFIETIHKAITSNRGYKI